MRVLFSLCVIVTKWYMSLDSMSKFYGLKWFCVMVNVKGTCLIKALAHCNYFSDVSLSPLYYLFKNFFVFANCRCLTKV